MNPNINKPDYAKAKNLFISIDQTIHKEKYIHTIKTLKKDKNVKYILCIEGIFIFDYASNEITSLLKKQFEHDNFKIELTDHKPIEKQSTFDNIYILSSNYYALQRNKPDFDIRKTFYRFFNEIKGDYEYGIDIDYNSLSINHNIEDGNVTVVFNYKLSTGNKNNIEGVQKFLEKNYESLLKKYHLIL